MRLSRRSLLLSGAASFVTGQALAQAHHHDMFSNLREPGKHGLPAQAEQQRVYDSTAPKATPQGRWAAKASLLLPRSEMAWATAWDGRMHVVGGYGEQRVDRPYHHVYIASEDRWREMAPLPRGGNHVGVVATSGRLYAIGGHEDQNRKPYPDCFVYDIAADRWTRIAPLPRARGAAAIVAIGGRIHSIGGAIGDTTDAKLSIDWHDVYDPTADRWTARSPLPLARDHTGTVVFGDNIHVIGGRINSFAKNVGDHNVYNPATDTWTLKAPLPTPRSGHGAVLYRSKIFTMGGEETGKVFAQNEAYDPATDSWMQYAPMMTPRHGLGAATIGDAIYVAGGGPVVGGGVQSAIHEAFTLA